jgi:HD-GYP domain-containing protein (c-di-GMP phosphodiesterase class II)
LTETERTLIKTHATKGADLLQSLSSVSAEVIRAVRHHHERFDGTGYPSGLLAEEIPIAARIIMMSDAVDAMLSDRPYRRALPLVKVRSELIRCSGSQFDPSIVQAVLANNTLERAAGLVGRSQSPDLQLISLTESA